MEGWYGGRVFPGLNLEGEAVVEKRNARTSRLVPSTVGIFNELVRVRVHNTKIRFRFVVGFSRGHTRTKVRFTYYGLWAYVDVQK